MRILMLGWEFPPHITGGLGTACHGLTTALNDLGHDIHFILPAPVPPTKAKAPTQTAADHALNIGTFTTYTRPQLPRVRFAPILTPLHTPYATAAPAAPGRAHGNGRVSHTVSGEVRHPNQTVSPQTQNQTQPQKPSPKTPRSADRHTPIGPAPSLAEHRAQNQAPDHQAAPAPPIGFNNDGPAGQYFGDLVQEAQRYATFALQRAMQAVKNGHLFDVIHAHDWMTFPAGLAIAAQSGKPLVVHFHATEHDRNGLHPDHRIADLERRACHAAVRIVAVSRYTQTQLLKHYQAPQDRIDIIHNACPRSPRKPRKPRSLRKRNPVVTDPEVSAGVDDSFIFSDGKTVLFLGRITHQKGPEYFVQAAKKVLGQIPDARFVLAGAGDAMHPIIELAARQGVGHRVLFTGFLHGEDVDRAFAQADVFVMPSVSEPFGIAALEAVRADVPLVLSKQSGVAEVIHHALKADFWNTDEIAEKIIALLNHPALGQAMTANAEREIENLTWENAAGKLLDTYAKAVAAVSI